MSTGTPDEEANRVLTDVWAANGQIQIPVDPIAIAQRLGIDVYASALDADVSAVIVANPGYRPTIYVSENDHLNRQRFSCSHEIGHFIRRRATGSTVYGFIDRRDDLSSKGTHPEEMWANRFAAALLMPAHVLWDTSLRDPGQLAPYFGVSPAAMSYRLKNLGLIT